MRGDKVDGRHIFGTRHQHFQSRRRFEVSLAYKSLPIMMRPIERAAAFVATIVGAADTAVGTGSVDTTAVSNDVGSLLSAIIVA